MNADQLPNTEFSILPAGRYRVGVKNMVKQVGKSSGVGYLKIGYTALDAPHKGRIIFDNISLSPAALWRVRAFLEAIGELKIDLPIEKGADGAYVIIDEDEMANNIISVSIGQELEVEVSEEPENKEKNFPAKNNVTAYAAADARSKWDN